MTQRPRPPAPRTLSATPPAASRSPKSSAYQARFPSLVAVIAGGALVPACHDVECGSNRADELQTHGADALRAARNGRAAEGLREIAVALGVVKHTTTSRISAPGEAPVVTTTQPTPPPPGAAPMVDPTPPPVQPSGGIMAVQPEPPPPRPIPQHHTTQPRTRQNMPVPGGMPAVRPSLPERPSAPVPDNSMQIEGGVRPVTHLPPSQR